MFPKGFIWLRGAVRTGRCRVLYNVCTVEYKCHPMRNTASESDPSRGGLRLARGSEEFHLIKRISLMETKSRNK